MKISYKKKTKVNTVIILILTMFVLFLIGYLLYEKNLSNKDIKCNKVSDNKNVYKYKLSDLVEVDIKGEKLNISNVDKLIHVEWSSKD